MRRSGAAVLAAALLSGAGAAYALWTGLGAGTGQASTADPAPVVLSPGTPAATLHPGGRADVVLMMTNPGGATVVVPSLELDPGHGIGGFAVDTAHAGCTPDALSFVAAADGGTGGTGWTVPGRAAGGEPGRREVTLTNAIAMSVDAATACQGATFTVYLRSGS